MKVFISHSFEDKTVFDNLCVTLEEADIAYWNPKEMAAGTSLRDQLKAVIAVCPVCIFIATRDSLASAWCQAEVGAFWGANKPVVVYLSDTNVPEGSLPKQFKEDLYATGMREVISSVKFHLASKREKDDLARTVDGEVDERSRVLTDVVSKLPENVSWEPPLQESVDRFPEPLKRILASNLAERLRNRLKDPDILLAVQESGQWLAEYLAKWLTRKPLIIFVEKDIPPDRVREYLEIPLKGVKERPNLFIVHKELDENSGNMVIVDDFIDSGGTVLSIVERLKTRNVNVKTVATIAVTKTNLDKLQDYLKNNAVELVYLLTVEGALPCG